MGNFDVDKAMQTLVEHGFIDKDGHPINIRSDAISRAEVHDLLATWLSDKLDEKTREVLEVIDGKVEDMSPITPKQRTGHWIECEDEVKCFCSECKEISDYPTKFCPNCGAKMVEPQESEEQS